MAEFDDFARSHVTPLLRPGEHIQAVGALGVFPPVLARLSPILRVFYPHNGPFLGVATNQRLILLESRWEGLGKVAMVCEAVYAIELSEVVSIKRINPMMVNCGGMRLRNRDGRTWDIAWLNEFAPMDEHRTFVQQFYPWLEGQLASGGIPAADTSEGQTEALATKPQVGRYAAILAFLVITPASVALTLMGVSDPSLAAFYLPSLVAAVCVSAVILRLLERRAERGGPPVTGALRAKVRGGLLTLLAFTAFIGAAWTFDASLTYSRMYDEDVAEARQAGGAISRYQRERLERSEERLGEMRTASVGFLLYMLVVGPVGLILLGYGFHAGLRDRVAGVAPAAKVFEFLTR